MGMPMPVSLLFFVNTLFIWFHKFTAREILPQDEPYLEFHQHLIRLYLDETFRLGIDAEMD